MFLTYLKQTYNDKLFSLMSIDDVKWNMLYRDVLTKAKITTWIYVRLYFFPEKKQSCEWWRGGGDFENIALAYWPNSFLNDF